MSGKFFSFENLKQFLPNLFIILRENQNEEKIYTYSEITKISHELFVYFSSINLKKTRICVQCHHSPELCIILLSLLNLDCSFCPVAHDVTEENLLHAVNSYASTFLITTICLPKEKLRVEQIWTTNVLNTKFYIYKIFNARNELEQLLLPDECYCVRTSGSTGSPKIVRVPYKCIEPNILHLSHRLQMSSQDLICMLTPITFDPFVVEFFLALQNGSALLITTAKIQSIPNELAKTMQPRHLRGASVVQMTPSKFRNFGLNTITNIVLGEKTDLRILLLGGERFPSAKDLLHWTSMNNSKIRIFNIYGITEVSCWSTLCEFNSTQLYTPIGDPIDPQTQVRLVNDSNEVIHEGRGYIQIGSTTRKCVIDSESYSVVDCNEALYRSTGDVGSLREGQIFYEGRQDDIVKRFGNRIHMDYIERKLLDIDGVVCVCGVFNEDNMQFICFIQKVSDKSEKEIRRNILAKLESSEKPDGIEFVKEFPLTSHGKVCKRQLLRLKKETTSSIALDVFKRFIENVLCLELDLHESKDVPKPSKQPKLELDLSFLDAGGTSFQALSLSVQIDDLLHRPESKLLEFMLNGTTSISDILDYIRKIDRITSNSIVSSDSFTESTSEILLNVKWKYNTGKCVDASPSCRGGVVCVGSHSHLLVTLDSKSGQKISSCTLPDRIECQVCFLNERIILVGCYDGYLYAVDTSTGTIEWKFNCEGMIKAKPLLIEDTVVIGSYSDNGNLRCLRLALKDQNLLWKIKIGSRGIFSSPIKINKKSLLACSLDGDTACVNSITGNIEWKKQFQSPVFSTPTLVSEIAVLIAEVSGTLHCLDSNSGTELWNYQTGGNIFSSIVTHNTTDKNFIIFGNHDCKVYCFETPTSTQQPLLCWTSTLNSAVYSTPVIFHTTTGNPAVLSCSTKGCIYIHNIFNGSTIFRLNLGNEIFSSPCVVENRFYVGCRDNHIICLESQYQNQRDEIK